MVRAVTSSGASSKPKPSGTASSADPRGLSALPAINPSSASSIEQRSARSGAPPTPYASNAGLKKTGAGATAAPTNNTSAGDGGPLSKPVAIIVTAHNASATIKSCLEAVLAGAAKTEVEVVVVCYACDDDTAAQAKTFGTLLKVMETKSLSKTAALNLADKSVTAFPRFYVDSHALLNIDAIRKVANILRTSDNVEAAAPAINIDISESSWPVRAYYQIWLQRDRVRYGLMGSGVFAVSELGHSRFHKFPLVMAEDLYVRLHFHQRRRRTLTSCAFKIKAPSSIAEVFRQRVHQRIGMCEIKELFPALLQNENPRGVLRDLFSLMGDLSNILPMFLVYIPLCVFADINARVRNLYSWWRPKHRPEPKGKRDPNEPPRKRRSPSDYDDGEGTE